VSRCRADGVCPSAWSGGGVGKALGPQRLGRGALRRGYDGEMRQALSVLLQVQAEGLLAEFAIGGAVAASFFAATVATEDLDIFAFLQPSASGLLSLTPLYERLQALGGRVQAEHVVIGTWPVQVLPAYTPLVEEAVSKATNQLFEDLTVRVVDATYLCAIALQTGRAKDYLRVHSLIESGHVDGDALRALVNRFALNARWDSYARRYA
jgi:hypothetical protein